MDKFVTKKARLEVDDTASQPPTIIVSSIASSSSGENRSQPKPGQSGKGRSFQKSWLIKYTWLEYEASTDKVFCKTCKEADAKNLLQFSSKKEDAFISIGFSNWKKALEKFRLHENTFTHKEGVLKINSITNRSVASQLNEQLDSDMKKARLALETIFTTVQFLCRQGLAIRGHEDVNSNFVQLLELRKNDVPELKDWLGRSGYKWTSHDIQNEIIDLLGKSVLRKVLASIKRTEHFSIMVDETSDSSIREQVSFCIRTVDDSLIINEDFIGLYETPNTESQTLFSILKDVFARLDLSMDNLRGQCYDGASNMRGKFKGLKKLVLDIQPKARYVHCTAHSLNLAVVDSLRHLTSMRDIMALAKDLINTVRESNKRMELFRSLRCESANDQAGLRPLCPTRWTMRASSILRILKNFEELLEFFETFSAEDKTEAGYKCEGYLESMLQFKTYFFLRLYFHAMNPVEDVNEKIQCPHLSVADLEKIYEGLICILNGRRDSFEHFWELCLKEKPSQVDDPSLPRNRRIPKKYENNEASSPHTFKTPKEYYKAIYIEVCETVQSCITERFASTGLTQVIAVEQECLLLVNRDETNFEKSTEFFKNDLDIERLRLHLNMLADIANKKQLVLKNMSDVRKYITQEPAVGEMLCEVVKCIKLLQVVPITTAAAERSFSVLRRLKSYLRSTMGQKRLNNLAVLHAHRDVLDELDIRPVINDFIFSNPVRQSTFAPF